MLEMPDLIKCDRYILNLIVRAKQTMQQENRQTAADRQTFLSFFFFLSFYSLRFGLSGILPKDMQLKFSLLANTGT